MEYEKGLIRAIRSFDNAIATDPSYAKYKPVRDYIIAQWILESGWGRSKLAKLGNYGGMKYRQEIANMVNCGFIRYGDWDDQNDWYFVCQHEDYYKLYIAFINRQRYLPLNLSHGFWFAYEIARCGYVGSMKKRGGEYCTKEELPSYYALRLYEIIRGRTFKKLMSII